MVLSIDVNVENLYACGETMNKWTLWVMQQRSRMYVSIAQFIMIFWLFIQNIGNYVVVPVVLGLLALVTYIDWRYIFSNELKRSAEKNPITMEVLKLVREIHKEVVE